MKIAIASDHAALELKTLLVAWLREQRHDVADLGPDSAASVDYPDFGYKLAAHVASGQAERGRQRQQGEQSEDDERGEPAHRRGDRSRHGRSRR